jgi:hypothetical protein
MKTWFGIAGVAIAVVLIVSAGVAWQAEVRARAALQDQLKTAQQDLVAANGRESARNTALHKQLALLRKNAAAVQTPEEVIGALPGVLPLPKPIEMVEPPAAPASGSGRVDGPTPQPQVSLPLEDLKPLYDSAVRCKECQAELAVAQADLKDEKVKTGALSRERDDALRVAKGGSVLQRVARAAKWILIGAAAGAVAARAAR